MLCGPQTQCLCFGMKEKLSQMDIFKPRQKKTACVTRYHQSRPIDKHQQCMHVCLCVGVFGVCVCAAASCTQFCLDLRHNVLLFSSTRQCPTQASVGLQHEMRASIQGGGGCFDPLSWQAHSAVPVFANTLDAPGILHRLIPLLNTSLMHCTGLPLYACFSNYMAASAQM